jgi:hypothetical protein
MGNNWLTKAGVAGCFAGLVLGLGSCAMVSRLPHSDDMSGILYPLACFGLSILGAICVGIGSMFK